MDFWYAFLLIIILPAGLADQLYQVTLHELLQYAVEFQALCRWTAVGLSLIFLLIFSILCMLRNCVTIKIHLWWQELKNLQTPSSMWTVITLRIRQSMSIREACFEKNGLLFGFCSNISYLCTDWYTDIQIYTVILKKLSCVRLRVYVRVRYFWKTSVCICMCIFF